MSLASDLLELSEHLQQEHLFVTTEREQLQRLYHSTTLLSERVFHSAWIVRQQKHNLQQFINLGNTGDSLEAYVVNNQLEETNFVDSYKVFSYHDAKYGDLFRFLYEHPSFIATIILEGEKQGLSVSNVINVTVSSIYANCLFREDEQAVLCLLKSFLDCQVASSDNPRRLIRRQTAAFSKVFRLVSESLFSARLFLTAALYEPIMCLLMEDEWFYDIDPDKAFVRFPADEKVKRFGEPGTDEHKAKQEQYRKFIVDKLVVLALRFINGIKAKIHCFPSGLGWLVSQVYHVLTEKGQISMQEIRACCADLVFSLFICPAICDPEPHGIISDVAISHIARHNLMQMAQIVQVMAISQWDEIDPKLRDLYGRFDKGSISSILDLFLEGCWDDFMDQMTGENLPNMGASRSAVLLTTPDMKEMIGFLRNALPHVDDKVAEKKRVETLLSTIPNDIPPSSDSGMQCRGVITPPIVSSSPNFTGGASSGHPDSPGSVRKPLFKSKGPKKKSTLPTTSEDGEPAESEAKAGPIINDVLVLSIYPPNDCPGMVPEVKVLSSLEESSPAKTKPQSPLPPDAAVAVINPAAAPNPEVQEKRTRFSLSHDQESIGNASDYQEVISEAASSHSVEDEENELETDNFSDMMSANVSGRGSPSISGRDTPLSQAGSVEENPVAPQLPVPVPETVRKENRVDVTDRFGKFEIKAELVMERDECKSTVSDTWSTDVLASDSEPPEQNQVDRLEEVAEEISRPFLPEPISEISETASDAWSTDVLASDTDEKHSELLKDLEQDLMSGVLDRDEGDNSIGQDEGEDQSLENDHLGAVGGASPNPPQGHSLHSDSCEAFPDVFSDPPPISSQRGGGSEDGDNVGSGGNSSSARKSALAAGGHHHHTTGYSSLQLPSSGHRSASRNADSRATVGFANLMESTTVPGTVHASTGARSKVKDKEGRRRMRDSRGSGSGSALAGGHGVSPSSSGMAVGENQAADFDPLSSGGSSSGSFRGWKNGRKNSRNALKLEGVGGDGAAEGSDVSSSMSHQQHHETGRELFPSSSSSRTKSQHIQKSSRNSGTDIWVSTNGQISGSSSRSPGMRSSQSSFDSSSDNFSPAPDQTSVSMSSRSAFESNLQRLQDSGVKSFSTPDSGRDSGFSVSTEPSERRSVEMGTPLFQLMSDSGNVSTAASNSSSSMGMIGKSDFLMNPKPKKATGVVSNLSQEEAFQNPLCQVPLHESTPAAQKPTNNRGSSGVEVDIFQSIASLEMKDKDESADLLKCEEDEEEEVNLGEQQNMALNERRLSSALVLFDPLCTESDDCPIDAISDAFDAGAMPNDRKLSVKSAEVKPNGVIVVVQQEDDDEKRDPELDFKKHQRHDSSGSSHSASSLKINIGEETSPKDTGGDNISLISTMSTTSDDKDLTEEERAVHRHKKGGRGFLSSVRDKFSKGMRRKNTKFEKDFLENVSEGNSPGLRKNNSSSSLNKEAPTTSTQSTESTDDILAKYRTPRKPATKITVTTTNNNSSTVANNNISSSSSLSAGAGAGGGGSNNSKGRLDCVDGAACSTGPNNQRGSGSGSSGGGGGPNSPSITVGGGRGGQDGGGEEEQRRLFFDPDNLESCPAFFDAKRKLRIVLSMGDVYFNMSQVHSSSPRESLSWKENEVIHLLHVQLAEAINLQNKDFVAQLYEVIRCIKLFDSEGCKKLLASMREDYQRRSPYVSYLVRCRQGLLSTRSHLQRLLNRVNRDKEIYNKHLSHMTARRFLERSDKKMWRFITEFQKLTMSDEKIDLVEKCLNHFYQEMMQDSLWRNCSESQMDDAQFAVERFLMSRIYTHAMFPNGDGDILRDQLLQEHLRKLSKVISPSHKDLRIPPVYHTECPWPAAQKEIYKINAYRTPKDKIQCVLCCAQTIMNLLSLANQKSVPAADDFMPVLIFVLIKANPFGLLSTIQYVNSFYANRIHGEEQYWWLQLTSAVEFIKTMDYSQ